MCEQNLLYGIPHHVAVLILHMSSCFIMLLWMACRTYCVCHLQGHWMNWGSVLLEHWNVLQLLCKGYAPVVIMTSVSTSSLPTSYSTLAVCCSLTYHSYKSDTCLSFSNLTFLSVILPGLLLSIVLKYLLVMENFSSVCPGAYVNLICDFDKKHVYKL